MSAALIKPANPQMVVRGDYSVARQDYTSDQLACSAFPPLPAELRY